MRSAAIRMLTDLILITDFGGFLTYTQTMGIPYLNILCIDIFLLTFPEWEGRCFSQSTFKWSLWTSTDMNSSSFSSSSSESEMSLYCILCFLFLNGDMLISPPSSIEDIAVSSSTIHFVMVRPCSRYHTVAAMVMRWAVMNECCTDSYSALDLWLWTTLQCSGVIVHSSLC